MDSIRWASDGVHLQRGSGKEMRLVDPLTGTAKADASATSDDQKESDAKRARWELALQALEGVDEKVAGKIAAGRRSENKDGSVQLFVREGSLYTLHADEDGEGFRALDLLRDGHAPELAQLSPSGAHVAYVEGNDLFIVDTQRGFPKALTSDGDEETFNGKLDWVYQEEIYGRGRFKAFWWSPDSKHIAFLRLDERAVHEFTVVDHIEKGTFRVKPEVTNYPKAGDPNPTVMLGVAGVDGGTITWVDLDKYTEDEPLVVRVGWTPKGDRVLFALQDRIQTWLDLNSADPQTGEFTTLIHESSDSWVDVLGLPRYLEDGSFLWRSARTGFRHLYHYSAAGEQIARVTSGSWKFGSVERLDEDKGLVWYTASRDGAVNANLYVSSLSGGDPKRLTSGEGRHSVSWNEDKSLFIDRVSSLASPGEIRLCNADGKLLEVLATATVPASETYAMGQWELFEVEARDNFALDVALLKPADFDPKRSYAVWLPTYSGPDSPSVRNSWNSSAWYQYLAQQGTLVLQVNVRSASGKGHKVIESCYRQLGIQELRDLEDAVAWLTKNEWADQERVGITGYSYGGFMSAFALTHSKAFALGVAGGGVYDWGMYDTVYTERYMSTPQKNPKGYAETSCLKAAGNLSGHLVLHAGVMDDNVHVQNTMQFAYALQRAGKDFEMMVYPQQRHGIRDAEQRWFSRRMEWRAIQQTLLQPKAVSKSVWTLSPIPASASPK
ncbi:MAG: dipeptidyl-peptidase-4 [Planctomycetota bacterium]|jgi:dipeptidyl-peptidase-4